MADWPNLGQMIPPVEQTPVPLVMTSTVEHGPPKRRSVGGKQLLHTKMRYRLTHAEFIQWREWYQNTINHGASSFNWIDPFDGVSKTAWLLNGNWRAQAETGGNPIGRILEVTLETWDV